MIAQKAFYLALFVVLGLFSSAHGANPNKNDGESYEEEDLGFHVGLGGKWPWDWSSNIGAHLSNEEGPNDDIGLGFDLGNDGPISITGKPSNGGAESGGSGGGTGIIGGGSGIGPSIGDDGCGGCLSDCSHCGSNGNPSTGNGESGGIGPGTGTVGPGTGNNHYRSDDGCGGCLSDPLHCGSGSFNQPIYCTPVNRPDGGVCGGFGLHLDLGLPSLFEGDRPHHAHSEPINVRDTNQN